MPSGRKYEDWLDNPARGKAMDTVERSKKYRDDVLAKARRSIDECDKAKNAGSS